MGVEEVHQEGGAVGLSMANTREKNVRQTLGLRLYASVVHSRKILWNKVTAPLSGGTLKRSSNKDLRIFLLLCTHT